MDGEIYIKQKDRDVDNRKKQNKKKNNRPTNTAYRYPEPEPPEIDLAILKIRYYYPNHSLETIERVMKRCNNDMEKILNEMLEEEEDPDLTRCSSNECSKKMQYDFIEEDLLLNLEREVEINNDDFDQLFDEITYIIQKRDEMSLVYQKQLIDCCKDSLDEFVRVTVGFAEELGLLGVEYDDMIEREGLSFYLQLFIEQLARKRNEESKKKVINLTEDEFPSLSSNKYSIPVKLHNDYKKSQLYQDKLFQKKTDYFNLKNKPNAILGSHFQLTEGDAEGAKDIKQLISEYEGMDIKDIRIIYFNLENDIELCRKFLKTYYSQSKSSKREYVILTPKKRKVSEQYKTTENYEMSEELNQKILNLSLYYLRDYIMHHTKVRAVFISASSRISGNEKRRLQNLGNQYNDVLRQYMKASEIKFIEKALKSKNPQEIDFHGYFLNESIEIAEKYIKILASEARDANPKIEIKSKRGRYFVSLHIITGKGLGSENKKSVLKPGMQDMCNRLGLDFSSTEGGVLVQIPV